MKTKETHPFCLCGPAKSADDNSATSYHQTYVDAVNARGDTGWSIYWRGDGPSPVHGVQKTEYL
jgi:hypothetical protein